MARPPDPDLDHVHECAGRALGSDCEVERTSSGVSAAVYRVRRRSETFYLRLAEERDENLEVDALVHERLRAMGVRVAEVVHVDRFVEALDRSVLVTSDIGGDPLSWDDDPEAISEVLRDAGRQLALINTVEVVGFGWIERTRPVWPVHGELDTYPEFVAHDLPQPWPGRFAEVFDDRDLSLLEELIASEQQRTVEVAHLAHGDFDLEHIFHDHGRYTGVIDFGDTRGTEPLFDLGVYAFARWRRLDSRRVDAVLKGYAEVIPLAEDAWFAIRRAGVLKSARHLGAWLTSNAEDLPIEDFAKGIALRLAQLS